MLQHLVAALLLTSLLALPHADAAQVKAIKGKKILIDLQSDSFVPGDVLKIENKSGKTVGLAKVTKVKGAVAEAVIKGKAEKGFNLKLRPAKTAKTKKSDVSLPPRPTSSGESKMTMGGMLGFNMASADVVLPLSGDKVALSGTGFSLKGFMDYPLFPWLSFRGLGGLEQFMVGGANNDECGGECNAEINYLTFDFWGKVNFGQGNWRPWAGLGFDVMFPLSKASTALAEKSITNTSIIALGGGVDWMMSGTSYMPIQFEYNMYPSSEEVKASAMALRVGYGMNF